MRDPYTVLGVRRSAGPDEIKSAWRTAAKAVHPDQNPDDPLAVSRFTEVGRAYDVLKDPDKRSRYDRARQAAESRRNDQTFMEQRAQAMAAERAEEDARARQAQADAKFGEAGGRDNDETAEEMVSRIFGSSKPAEHSREPSRDDGPKSPSQSSHQDTMHGDHESEVERDESQPGPRLSPALDLLSYLVRRLTRQIPSPEKAPELAILVEVSLEDVVRAKSQTATLPDGKLVSVPLALGISDGDSVRLDGYGHRLAGMRRGDVLAIIRFKPHPWFRVDGYDLVTPHPVDIENAVLGCETMVETLDGPVNIIVPEWSGSDHIVIVEGGGLPKPDATRGDLLVEVRVMLWDFPDQKVIDLMRSLREGLFL